MFLERLGCRTHHGGGDAVTYEETPRLAAQVWNAILADIRNQRVGNQSSQIDGPIEPFNRKLNYILTKLKM